MSQARAEDILEYNNSFIHGTTSLIFTTLHKTDMSLMGPMEMLEKYHLAPIGGEFTSKVKGYLPAMHRLGEKSAPRFGKVNGERKNDYDLRLILQRYANLTHVDTAQQIVERFSNKLSQPHTSIDNSLGMLLVYIVQAKELGVDLFAQLKNGEAIKHSIINQIKNKYQVLYLVLLLGKYVHPRFTEIEDLAFEDRNNIADAASTFFTFEKLSEKIIQEGLDLKAIYEMKDPTEKDLAPILKIFDLPKKCVVKSNFGQMPREVKLALTNPFQVSTERLSHFPDKEMLTPFLDAEYSADSICSKTGGQQLNFYFHQICSLKVKETTFRKLDPYILKHEAELEKPINLLLDILQDQNPALQFSTEDKKFLDNPFPIILMSDQCQDFLLKQVGGGRQEFEALKPLKFGVDITNIATDTKEHQQVIENYFKLHNVNNIKTILISDLEKSYIPFSPDHKEKSSKSLFGFGNYFMNLFSGSKKQESDEYKGQESKPSWF